MRNIRAFQKTKGFLELAELWMKNPLSMKKEAMQTSPNVNLSPNSESKGSVRILQQRMSDQSLLLQRVQA